ncbi:hypothetical protein GLYMA_16G004600v4 [Glycine max]|uniref:Uncharacterized protein n=1 Tax=Glycine max TaxID=3847 RepID=A0A0R0FJ72_SOYBN|nr:hypothetical protein JHK87_043832 [Glycine soja]KAG4950723.1 hypothetical protein JHK85_044590 [Glycine max]KAG5107201.1 hypothetical protein JHK84_044108 [Glycine max]KAH1149256.1 hypothetical protein GYH30_043718 [Glycine max]KRH06097.1 hypothetical protein GLYMA_16G004600v4 [Glycine max]
MLLHGFHLICSLDISSNSFRSLLRRRSGDIINSYFLFFFFRLSSHMPVAVPEKVSIIIKPEPFIKAPQPIKRSIMNLRIIVLEPC